MWHENSLDDWLNNGIRGEFTARIVGTQWSHLSQCSALLPTTIVSQKGQLSDVGVYVRHHNINRIYIFKKISLNSLLKYN